MPLSATDCPAETNVSDFLSEPIAWIIAHTMHPKDFVSRLPEETPYALPYLVTINQSRQVTRKPLFPGYAFVGERRSMFPSKMKMPTCPRANQAARSTKRLLSILSVGDQLRLRAQLALFCTGNPEERKTRVELKLEAGKPVKFTHDSGFWGLTGLIKDWKAANGRIRVFVQACTLGQTVSVETDVDKIRNLEPH